MPNYSHVLKTTIIVDFLLKDLVGDGIFLIFIVHPYSSDTALAEQGLS
ncbi:MAG: hypothetical protein AAFO04_02850 [Cyanobacteria bacterium J06592_8]